jgi:hypothetical protein
VQFNPRPVAPEPGSDEERASEVTDLNKAAERNRRAAE